VVRCRTRQWKIDFAINGETAISRARCLAVLVASPGLFDLVGTA
jgi:hypothetical protein